MQSKLIHLGQINPSLNLLSRDPVLFLTQDGGRSFEWNYSKCDMSSSEFDQSVTRVVLCVYNYICVFYVLQCEILLHVYYLVICLKLFNANFNVVLTLRTMLLYTSIFCLKKKVSTEVLPSYWWYRKHGCELCVMGRCTAPRQWIWMLPAAKKLRFVC